MVRNSVASFTDPEPYQAAVRPAQVEVLVTAKGNFRAELTRIELPQIWIQRGSENLPRVVHSAVSAERSPIFFLASPDQASMRVGGIDAAFGEIFVAGLTSTQHHRTEASCHWATLSLTKEDLAASGYALVGRDLTVPLITHRIRPALPLMSRLLNLHAEVGRLAETAPHILTQPEPVRALEQALMHATIKCLSSGAPVEADTRTCRHSAIVERFEELLALNQNRPLYLAEICTAIGFPNALFVFAARNISKWARCDIYGFGECISRGER